MRVLLVGSGGREHAIAWKLRHSPLLGELHAAPGNPGIAQLGECHPVRAEDAEGLLDLAHTLGADLVVVGPEVPLVAGVADELRHAGVSVFGPSRAAAQIEGSKSFAKDVMRAAGVPFAETMSVARPPCVLKADGLAAGKGVFVCPDQASLDDALARAARLGQDLVIEELLEGEELSVFGISDGRNVVGLSPARDFKRLSDGDEGPNTGGMGSFSPVPGFDDAALEELLDAVHRPVIRELADRGSPFVGLLYAGLMLTEMGPKVLEFNCRFGDPETQSILPRLDGDLLDALAASVAGELTASLGATDDAAVTVVISGGAYPDAPDVGTPVDGITEAEAEGALVLHAGTATRKDRLVTNGGRVLNVVGVGPTVDEARRRAYAACRRISFDGMHYRRDIAEGAVAVV